MFGDWRSLGFSIAILGGFEAGYQGISSAGELLSWFGGSSFSMTTVHEKETMQEGVERPISWLFSGLSAFSKCASSLCTHSAIGGSWRVETS